MRYNNQDTQSSLSQLRKQPTVAEGLQSVLFKTEEMEESSASLSFSHRNDQAEESQDIDFIEYGRSARAEFNAEEKKMSIARNLKN